MFDFLQPRPSRAVLAALDALDFGKHDYIASEYRARVARFIRQSPRRTAQTLARQRNPSAVALLVMLDTVGAEIATGNHHSYRGLLSMSGDMLAALFHDITRQLRECKAITDEESDQAHNNLRDWIKAAG